VGRGSLRHTFATMLSKGGVAPRVAQAAMRHASVEMTLQTYTDPKLLDVAGALEVLPGLRLEQTRAAEGGVGAA
jgi:integrase